MDFLQNIPSQAGIYKMLDKNNKIIYIGKAKNLKKRVLQYFSNNKNLNKKTQNLVLEIYDLKYIIVKNEYDAFLLENNLIKEFKPKYNIIFKDDKTYPYLVISKEKFPRIFSTRNILEFKNKNYEIFGPFSSISSSQNMLKIIQDYFKVRQCTNVFFANRTNPCLSYQIKKCDAPCVGFINKEKYSLEVKNLVSFLNGKYSRIFENLTQKMMYFADKNDFENAIYFRDKIKSLQNLQLKQNIEDVNSFIESCNIFAFYIENNYLSIFLLEIQDGKIIGDKNWILKYFTIGDNKNTFFNNTCNNFLYNFYINEIRNFYPKIIITQDNFILDDNLINILKEKRKDLKFINKPKNIFLEWLNLALKNAQEKLNLKFKNSNFYIKQLLSLQESFKIDFELKDIKINCFDISHFSGEFTYGSCVYFDKTGKNTRNFRLFKITNITKNDDYDALKQAISKWLKNLNYIPNIIIVDGGKGQINIAYNILKDSLLKKDKTLLISLSKGKSRIDGDENCYYFYKNKLLEINFHKDNIGFLLLRKIRNEAHNFALKNHRKNFIKNSNKSVLENIEGIGDKKAQKIISYIGGLQELKNCSIEKLESIPGISSNLAKKVWNFLRSI